MNFFDDDTVEEEYVDPKKRLAQKSLENYNKSKKEEKKPLDIYQYDEIYEELKKGRKKEEKKKESSSKYIGNMKKVVDERKFVQNQIHEKKILQQIEKDKEIYGDTEVFYTKEYEEKLLQDKIKSKELEKKEIVQNQSKNNVGSFLLNIHENLITDKEENLESEPSKDDSGDLEFAPAKEEDLDFVPSCEPEEKKVEIVISNQSEKTPLKKDLYQRPSQEYINEAKERAKIRMELRLKNSK